MALVLFTKGAQLIMSRALNKSATGDLRLKLFKSNTTLTTATAIGDLTLADFTGYAYIGSGGATASGAASTAREDGQASEPDLYYASPSRPVPRRQSRTFRRAGSGGARVFGAAETRYDSPARRRRRREQQLLFEFGAAQEIP